MQRFALVIFINLFAVSSIYAQTKFEPGNIVTLEGRVFSGMIEYRNWSRNPETIVFRDNELKNETPLGVNDIAGFQVGSEIYERAVVARNVSDINTNDLPENATPVLEQDTVFLRTLADGQKSFYYLKDRLGKVQLYIGKSHELLIYHKYKIIRDNEVKVVTVDLYRQQIKAYLNCREADDRIKNLRYSSMEIENVFGRYFKKCGLNDPKSPIGRREGLGLEVGILAGATFSKLSFEGYNFEYLIDRKHDISTRPTAGIFLNLVIPRTNKKLLIVNELAYSSYKISDHFQTDVNPENFTVTDYTFGLYHLKLNNLIRYRITRSKAFFYANVGISNGFIISEDNRYVATTHFYTDIHIKKEKALDTRKHDQGFLLGIGAGIQKFGFEARFENSNGNSDYYSVSSNVKRLSLLVHYRF